MNKDRLTVILFALLLLLPFPSYLLLKGALDGENHENRTLAQFPKVSFDTVTEFPEGFDNWLDDRLPFKNQMVYANSLLDVNIFGRSSSGRGWLFYSDIIDGNCVATYKGIDLYSDSELELLASRLVDAKNQLAGIGCDFYLFIAPDKQQLYPEFMPAYITRVSEITRTRQLVDYLRQNTDIKVIYALDALTEGKSTYPVFYQLDTHWNDFGTYIGAKLLLENMGYDLCDYSEIVPQTPTNCGDLASVAMTGNMFLEHNNVIIKGDFGEYSTDLLDYLHLSRYCSTEPDCIDKKLMIERDSFTDSMIQFICPRFRQTVLFHRNNFDGASPFAEQPDIFVYETVERYLDQIEKFVLTPQED